MNQPPEFMMPLMMRIEKTVVVTCKEFPKLVDTDVEFVFEKLMDYYKILARGKEANEPETPSEMKQALIDEILNTLDEREENEADSDLINDPRIRLGEHPIPSLPHLYASAFKRLKTSARNWRKRNGRKGYITFITHSMPWDRVD